MNSVNKNSLSLLEQKSAWRKRIELERKSMSYHDWESLSIKIKNNLLELFYSISPSLLRNKGKFGIYQALHGEPDLSAIILQAGYVGFPKIIKNAMRFTKYSQGDALVPSAVPNILHTQSEQIFMPDVVIVPAMCFDVRGYRLGYGYGYYDRYLSFGCERGMLSVGACFHRWLFNEIPYDVHDCKMRYIVTETQVISLS